MKKLLFLVLVASCCMPLAVHAQKDTDTASNSTIIFPEKPRNHPRVTVRVISLSANNETFHCSLEFKARKASTHRFAHITFNMFNENKELVKKTVTTKSFMGQTAGVWNITLRCPPSMHQIFVGTRVSEGKHAKASIPYDLIPGTVKIFQQKIQ